MTSDRSLERAIEELLEARRDGDIWDGYSRWPAEARAWFDTHYTDPFAVGSARRRQQWAEWQAYFTARSASWVRSRPVLNANAMRYDSEYRGASYTSASHRLEEEAWQTD